MGLLLSPPSSSSFAALSSWIIMGGRPQRRKGKSQNKKGKISVIAKKKITRFIDQVHDDLKHKEKFVNLPKDEYLPGEGQHKRRLKHALDEPHTQKDAEAAAGMSH